MLLSRPELTSLRDGGRGRPGNGREGVVDWLVELEALPFHVSNTSRSSAVRLPSAAVDHDTGVCPAEDRYAASRIANRQASIVVNDRPDGLNYA